MLVVQLRYAYRLNPTPGQRRALARAFGCARVVFNDAVAARRAAREAGEPYPSDAALSKALTAAKRTPERAWLAEVSAVVLQQALADANTAYRNFFASLHGHAEGPQAGRAAVPVEAGPGAVDPVHQARPGSGSPPTGRLRLPGIGDVPVRWSRELPGEPSSVTVTVDAAGRYHASFVVDVPDAPLPPVVREVGIDLGLTHFAVLSDGRKVDNPRIARKAAAKLRAGAEGTRPPAEGLARTGSKSRRKVARCHARVADTRRDWLHKLSTRTRLARLGVVNQLRLLATRRRYRRDAVLVIKGTVPDEQGHGYLTLLSRELHRGLRDGGYRSLRSTFVERDNPASAAQYRRAGGRPLHGHTFYERAS